MDPRLRAHRRRQAQLLIDFARMANALDRRVAQGLEEEGLDITPAGSRVLLILFQAGRPLRASELATNLGISEVTTSRILRSLRESGWLTRTPDPQDGRAFLLHPTDRARAALPRFIKVSNQGLDCLFGDMDHARMQDLEDLVAQLKESVC